MGVKVLQQPITLQDIANLLIGDDNFVITFHVNPDYDAVGASLALYHALVKLKKNVFIVSSEPRDVFQKNFSFLPGYRSIKAVDIVLEKGISNFTLICLDSGDKRRIGYEIAKLFDNFKSTLNIDHHHDNCLFANINYVDSNISGTGEIIYSLIQNMNVEIDLDIAKCLYASIVGDSGSFRLDSTKPSTHRIAAELIELGVRPSEFNMNMFQNKSVDFIKFEGEVFSGIKSAFDNKVVWVVVKDEMFKRYNLSDLDSEGLVEDIGRIKEALIYFTIKEKTHKGIIAVSLRSKKNIDVSKVARKFGGGGHKNAAGVSFSITEPIDKIEAMLLEEFKRIL